MNHVFFITGAESTGKSALTRELAEKYGATGIPEFARTYLEALGRPYTYADVEAIARGQAALITKYRHEPLVFFDTCLIIIKVWFREVYQKIPEWIDPEIEKIGRGVYLLCGPDLPWEDDPLRENPDRREYLNKQYENELNLAGFEYFRVSGSGSARLDSAVDIVDRILGIKNKNA